MVNGKPATFTVKHYFNPKFRDVANSDSACVGPNQIDEIEPLPDGPDPVSVSRDCLRAIVSNHRLVYDSDRRCKARMGWNLNRAPLDFGPWIDPRPRSLDSLAAARQR
jgi:hypothetical protein